MHAFGASLFLNGQLRECFAVQVDGRNVKVTGSSNNELLYGSEMKLRNLNDSDLPWDAEEIEKIVETEIALKDLNIFKHFPAIGGFVPKLRQLVGREEILLDVAGKESRLRAEQIYGAARDKKGERLIGCIIGGPVGCAISIGIFILLNTNFTQAH
jgi:hypothetical protein